MKKYLFLLLFLMWPLRSAHAVAMDVWLSSNTATADTNVPLCGQYLIGISSVVYHAVVHEVVVSSAVATTTLTLYNSSFTATGVQSIGPITTSSLNAPYVYDTVFPNGLMYAKTGGAQVQIEYQCY